MNLLKIYNNFVFRNFNYILFYSETTSLIVVSSNKVARHTALDLEDTSSDYRFNSGRCALLIILKLYNKIDVRYFYRIIILMDRVQYTSMGSESKFFVIVTATIAVVLFVIIIDISITALRIPDLVFRHNNSP